ncbi:MAG: 23S rRNA (pseudouridine(1915)-N(3))-methyltransferase RlmH [Oscillospiraceae bacterium]|nr:23S rRNA (pseudouridine(1915)-N(3))-methyltransferase RlmH [Oscillospiraceae bacterium]
MLNINIICIGKIKETYWTQAIEEYTKRLSAFCKFSIIELDEEKIKSNPRQSDIEKTITAEGKRIISKISKGSFTVALCIEGKQMSSEKLSKKIDETTLNGYSTINFIIGGSWGLSDEVKNSSQLKLSMSEMTFPHQMARVILCEQIYRAFEISANGKYHK